MSSFDCSYITERVVYNPDTGVFTWKQRPSSHFKAVWACKLWNTKHAGSIAGSMSTEGYLRLSFDGIKAPAHRIAWMLVHGEIPHGAEIDHVNGIRTDNRISNLRLADDKQNGMNKGLSAANQSGRTGVHWHRKRSRWVSYIRTHGKLITLGYFKEKDDAIRTREAAEVLHFGEYHRTNNTLTHA